MPHLDTIYYQMVPPDPLSLLNVIGYCQYYWLPLHPDGETLLLRTQHTYATKHGEMELVPN